MKLSFHIGEVPITVIDTSAYDHLEEIHALVAQHDAILNTPISDNNEEEDATCQQLDQIRATLYGYGYQYDSESGLFV